MQTDMHYYGTYAMAVAAGIPKKDAEIIAYASQFVDDSTSKDSDVHNDGGFLYAITTAHNLPEALAEQTVDTICSFENQRKTWVPFHFFPGGEGESFYEKILCVKDGSIVREMLENYLNLCTDKDYALELIGIASHVYADTFSHYGFSGLSSNLNKIAGEVKITERLSESLFTYIKDKAQELCGRIGEEVTSLGHAGVATYPDRPYLKWEFQFNLARPEGDKNSVRDNQQTYLEGCEKLHSFLGEFASRHYVDVNKSKFSEIKEIVSDVLAFQGTLSERINKWKSSGLIDGVKDYCEKDWEKDKEDFSEFASSSNGINTNVYRFHQAATYHRYYVLKDLLPKHGIAVY